MLCCDAALQVRPTLIGLRAENLVQVTDGAGEVAQFAEGVGPEPTRLPRQLTRRNRRRRACKW